MRRFVRALLGAALALLVAAPLAVAAPPTEWVHVCTFQDEGGPNTNYGHVSSPGMHTPDAQYWTAWCQEMNGRVRGVKPIAAAVR